MNHHEPLVSVGLPIYNAGEHTRRILDNMIAQDYSNIEIIISDNASEDNTWAICQEYAQRDNRIRLSQNKENRGFVYNFHRVYELATGKYFMWVAHDDYWDSKFICQCVKKLEANPEAVMVYTDQVHIIEETQEKITKHFSALKLTQTDTAERIKTLLTFRPQIHAIIYGMYRRKVLQPLLPIPPIPSGDIGFLLHLMLVGPAVNVPEVLYERSVKPHKDFRTTMKMVRLNETLPPNFVIVLQTFSTLIGNVWKSDVTFFGKIRISLTIFIYDFSTYGIQFFPSPLRPILRTIKRSLVS
jgi:glycosyltransferase involved in cell wall biosynthesis